MPETFDMLFFLFTQGGEHDGEAAQMIILDLTAEDIPTVYEFFQNPGNWGGEMNYDVQGCVQLADTQTHFMQAYIMKPQQFLICGFESIPTWLHDVKCIEWGKHMQPETLGSVRHEQLQEDTATAIAEMEQDAERHTGDVDETDLARASDEGMYHERDDQP